MKKYIQCYPATSYFIMAFILAWGGSILAAGPTFFRGESLESSAGLMAMAMSSAHILSSIMMTSIVDGKQGLYVS